MKVCPKCRTEYDNKYSFCKKCGVALEDVQSHQLPAVPHRSYNDSSNRYLLIFGIVLVIVLGGVGFYHFHSKVRTLESQVNKQKIVINNADRNLESQKSTLEEQQQKIKELEEALEDGQGGNQSLPVQDNSRLTIRIVPETAYITGTYVRFRSFPNGSIIGNFDRGEEVSILENANNWYKVRRRDGSVGYVSAQYCKRKNGKYPGIIKGTEVRFRQTPNGTVIGFFRKGEAVTVAGKEGNWYYVRRGNGAFGYVSIDYCDIHEDYCPY